MRITFILQLTGNFVLISCLRNTISHHISNISPLTSAIFSGSKSPVIPLPLQAGFSGTNCNSVNGF